MRLLSRLCALAALLLTTAPTSFAQTPPEPKTPDFVFDGQHPKAVIAITFSRDGKYAASASSPSSADLQTTLLFWNLATKTSTGGIKVRGNLSGMTFVPESTAVLLSAWGGGSSALRRWDLVTGAVTDFATLETPLQCLVFTPDGQTLLAGGIRAGLYSWAYTKTGLGPMRQIKEIAVASITAEADNRHVRIHQAGGGYYYGTIAAASRTIRIDSTPPRDKERATRNPNDDPVAILGKSAHAYVARQGFQETATAITQDKSLYLIGASNGRIYGWNLNQ